MSYSVLEHPKIFEIQLIKMLIYKRYGWVVQPLQIGGHLNLDMQGAFMQLIIQILSDLSDLAMKSR